MEFMVQIVVNSNKHGRLNSNSKHFFNDFVRTMQMAKKKHSINFMSIAFTAIIFELMTKPPIKTTSVL